MMQYIDVAKSHGHVMKLGGNVPDKFLEQMMLQSNDASEATNSNDNNSEDETVTDELISSNDNLDSLERRSEVKDPGISDAKSRAA